MKLFTGLLLFFIACSNTSPYRTPQGHKESAQLQFFEKKYLNDLDLTIDEKLIKFHEIEQYTVRGMPDQKEFRQYFTQAFDKLVYDSKLLIHESLIEKENYQLNNKGQITNDYLPHSLLPRDFLEEINKKKYTQQMLSLIDSERFIKKFKNLNQNICHTYKHLYLYSFWKLLKLVPSFDYQSFYDLIEQVEDSNKEKFYFLKDIKRAIWTLRFLKVLNSKKIVSDCNINSLSLVEEFEKRYDFIFNFKPRKRRPLGFAVGMCGRPMNSHYLDDLVEGKTREKPSNWDFQSYQKIKDFIAPSN